MKLLNNVLRITYINKKAFKALTIAEKDRFTEKFDIIHNYLPFIRNFNPKLNNIINNSLINLVKNNRESFICELYVKFADQMVSKSHDQWIRDRGYTYKSAYNMETEHDFYEMMGLFTYYFETNYGEFNRRSINFRENKLFMNLWDIKFLKTVKYTESFYIHIVWYLFRYFLSHNELISDVKLFDEITTMLAKNTTLMDYYRMNYNDDLIETIPADLVKRYKYNQKKEML